MAELLKMFVYSYVIDCVTMDWIKLQNKRESQSTKYHLHVSSLSWHQHQVKMQQNYRNLTSQSLRNWSWIEISQVALHFKLFKDFLGDLCQTLLANCVTPHLFIGVSYIVVMCLCLIKMLQARFENRKLGVR